MSQPTTDRQAEVARLVKKLMDLSTGNPIAEEPRPVKKVPGGTLPAGSGGKNEGGDAGKHTAKQRARTARGAR